MIEALKEREGREKEKAMEGRGAERRGRRKGWGKENVTETFIPNMDKMFYVRILLSSLSSLTSPSLPRRLKHEKYDLIIYFHFLFLLLNNGGHADRPVHCHYTRPKYEFFTFRALGPS